MSTDDTLPKRRKALLRHIDNVNKNCQILGEKLIEKGEINLGHRLIANGLIHDNSKFYGIEWEHLHSDVKETNTSKFAEAVKNHTVTNTHHPEYWGGVENMPPVFVAEMVCDWAARSSEFGNDLRDWIKSHATKKYGMTVQSKPYKTIKRFVDLLLDPAFT